MSPHIWKHSTNWLTSSRDEPSFNVSLMHSAHTLRLSCPSQLTYISECFASWNVFIIMIQQLTLALASRKSCWTRALCRLGGRGTVHAVIGCSLSDVSHQNEYVSISITLICNLAHLIHPRINNSGPITEPWGTPEDERKIGRRCIQLIVRV